MAHPETLPPEPSWRSSARPRDLFLLDIASDGRLRELWQSPSRTPPSEVMDELPVGGFASPWGFWWCSAEAAGRPLGAVRVSVQDPSELSAVLESVAASRPAEGGDLPDTVTVEADDEEDEDLTVMVTEHDVLVFASDRTWEESADGILLAVAQWIRYKTMQSAFIELQHRSRDDQRHSATASLATIREGNRLKDLAVSVRNLISDWAYFTGPCTDPRFTCRSQNESHVYTSLVEEFDFESWGKRIDVVVDDVADTYEASSEKLFHYQLFIWGMAAELLIIFLVAALIFR